MTTVTEDSELAGLRDALGLLKDREQVAQRLLESSAKHSFDPDKELDWDAPVEDGKWFWPPELVSLYDTPLWRRMSEEQRMDLARHEAASLASLGIWFEIILMQLLVRHIYDKSVTSAHVRYALTEIADECRHSTMFARLVERIGCPPYGSNGGCVISSPTWCTRSKRAGTSPRSRARRRRGTPTTTPRRPASPRRCG